MSNYFPKLPDRKNETTGLAAYRSLGMIVFLDLDYWKGQSETPIGDYYNNLASHIQARTAYVVIGNENKPIGYATWNVEGSDESKIEITRQSAPFGGHLVLQKALRAHLPNVTQALSKHDRSARRDQRVW